LRKSIASRLALQYAVMLAVIVLLVTVASSVVLVYKLGDLAGDVVVAKHLQARILVDQFSERKMPLQKAAPQLVATLGSIGLSVAVFDEKGKFLAGDHDIHPRFLATPGPLSPGSARRDSTRGVNGLLTRQLMRPPNPGGPEMGRMMDAVSGGYVVFAPSLGLIWVAMLPYWKLMAVIALGAIVLAWFLGLQFSRAALRPLHDVSAALHALAGGEYAQQRFVLSSGDEMESLTDAYNDAAANVAAAMAERKNTEERMRQFVADAGHELRTPLTVIAGYIDVLRRGAVEEPTVARQILATMALEKEHMRSLIDRLMRLARLDSEAQPHPQEIDVADLLRSQCNAAKRLDAARSIDYSVDGPGTVVADRVELGEALWNVVENALKYAPDAAIHLAARRNNGQTNISVHDDGPGMSESERLHAFERFYRGDERGEISGTGLGLAIAKRAVERAGGRIAIDSAPGAGTTVTLTL